MSVTLQFPRESALISYLEAHPVTRELKEIDNKIIKTVANFFAEQSKDDAGLDLGVMLTMEDLNEKIKLLPENRSMTIIQNLITALKDCANGKEISETDRFPSTKDLITYLENHHLTNDPYLKEKKIIDAIAFAFANQDKTDMEIQPLVALVLSELNVRLKLHRTTLFALGLNLTAALNQCANGNEKKI